MTISSADRKLLWARAHNRCAFCRRPLTDVADSDALSGLILGEEAHILPRAAGGPRAGDGPRENLDAYANMILLCSEDHTRVDSQPQFYPPQALRDMKAEHEKWGERRIDGDPEFEPMVVRRGVDEDSVPFEPLTSGKQVWDIVAEAHAFGLRSLDESNSDLQIDAADAFLETAKDWGEIAGQLVGLSEVREAQRSLKSMLEELWAQDVYVWGRRLKRTYTGGVGAALQWHQAELIAKSLGDLEAERHEQAP